MTHDKNLEFDRVVREHFASVTAYARSATSRREIVEEAVQETFIRAWRYWPTFRHESGVLSWLITICRRVIIDLVQKDRPLDVLPDDVVDTRDIFEPTALDEMIRDLPLPQREVIVLCAVLGFDYAAAAHTLGIPVGTVRSRLSRARETLSQQLDASRAV